MTSVESPVTEPEVLLFEHSPYQNLDAIVQHDGQSVYFYLNEPPGPDPDAPRKYGTRACWVRNLVPGPMVVNLESLPAGTPPLLPRTHARSRDAEPLPNSEDLSIVWLEEGNGAAVVEINPETGLRETLAVIPPWSGREGFHGYAAGCAVEHDLCWPMPEHPAMSRRIEQAHEFWQSFEGPDPFTPRQASVLASYRKAIESVGSDLSEGYFAIDGGRFPPRGLVQWTLPDAQLLMTVGMSLCPQPAVELFSEQPGSLRRIELGICLPSSAEEGQVETLRQRLATLAAYPWTNFTWLGPGHSCGLPGLASQSPLALLVPDHQCQANPKRLMELEDYRGDPVSLLWLLPLTEAQQQQLESRSITPEALIPTLAPAWFDAPGESP